jgi:chlorobactene glucosyltransferase
MHLFGIILVASWVLALLNTVLNLALIPRLRRTDGARRASSSGFPLVTVIIPARNEERAIEATVRGMLAQTYPALELIVVNDRSTDGTAAILAHVGREDSRLRVIDGDEPPPGWLGKPWALHEGSRAAAGQLLLFVDADIHYASEAVGAAVEHLEATGASLLTLFPQLQMVGFWEWVAMPQLALVLFAMIPTWIANRTAIVDLGVGGGPGNLVRREPFDEAGGYGALRDAVVDDVGLARLLRSHGCRTAAVRAEELVSLRMYHGGREIVDGFTKNLFAVLGRSYFVTAIMLAAQLAFHLVPYLLAATGSVAGIVAVLLITAVRLMLFTSLRYGVANALFMHPVMAVFWSWVFVRSVWKTGIRGQMEWRGRKYDDRWSRFGTKR